MHVIYFERDLSMDEKQVALGGLINNVQQQADTVVLFCELNERDEQLTYIQDQLGVTSECVHVAPNQSIEWQVGLEMTGEKQTKLKVARFWHGRWLKENGQVILVSPATFFSSNNSLKKPSIQLVMALLAEQLEANYRLYIEENPAYQELVAVPFSGCMPYAMLQSYMALTTPIVASDFVNQMKRKSFSFEIQGVEKGREQANQRRIVVLPEGTHSEQVKPMMVKQTNDFYIVTINHYQLHRTPQKLMEILTIFDRFGLTYLIQSTSVDGLVFLLQRTKGCTSAIKEAIKLLEQTVPLDHLHLSSRQSFVSVAFTKEVDQGQVISNLVQAFTEAAIEATVIGSIYSKSSITCSVDSSQSKQLKKIMQQAMQLSMSDHERAMSEAQVM